MIPASLRRVLEQRHAGPKPDVTTLWRDGSMIRERADGRVEQLRALEPLPPSFPATEDNPFPHD